MSAELKPCPMCGSDQIGGVHDKVYCDACGLTVTKPRPLANAIDAWNTRAPAQGALTDAQIDGMWRHSCDVGGMTTPEFTRHFARAIEQRIRGQGSDAADAARFRSAIALDDNAESLYAAVMSNSDADAIRREFDAAIQAQAGDAPMGEKS